MAVNNNGGPTQTIALLPGSPAILDVPLASCKDVAGNPVTTDQRGIARPQGTACSTGAVEFAPPKLVVTKSLNRVGGTVFVTVTITNNGDSAATSVVLTVAKIGSVATTTSLPLTVGTGTIAADGGTAQAVVAFSVASGANTLTLDGTYYGGSFASTARVTVP